MFKVTLAILTVLFLSTLQIRAYPYGKVYISCEEDQLTIRQSLSDPRKLQVVVTGELRNILAFSEFLNGLKDTQDNGEIISYGEGFTVDWKPMKSGNDFVSVHIVQDDYSNSVYKNEDGLVLRALGSTRPGCITMPDGDKTCWGPGEFINKEVPLKNCKVQY